MKTFTKEELSKVLELHKKWLNNEEGGVRANLRGADLSYANLRNADLSYANLSDADLSNADLWSANLWSANLSDADLSNADLWSANLRGADLRGADLRGANLSDANLENTNMNVLCADFIKGINITVISTGYKHRIVKYNDTVYIGCEKHSLSHWLENYKEIGEKNGYSEKEIEVYGDYLKLLNKHKGI